MRAVFFQIRRRITPGEQIATLIQTLGKLCRSNVIKLSFAKSHCRLSVTKAQSNVYARFLTVVILFALAIFSRHQFLASNTLIDKMGTGPFGLGAEDCRAEGERPRSGRQSSGGQIGQCSWFW